MGKIIKLGIGFETGRANICELINTYYIDMLSQVDKYKRPVEITIFLMYDLEYQEAKKEEFYNIKPEILKKIKIRYITSKDINNAKRENSELLSKKECNLFFGYGHAKGRNTILYFALKEGMDYLMYWDDDEYPIACIKEKEKITWQNQDNILTHLNNIEKSDITIGYHCGYISPIPYIDFNKDIDENTLKTFIEAISNELVSWSSIKEKMIENYGVTYADKNLAEGKGAYVLKDKWVSGTNLCLNLSHLDKIPAFYNPLGARGEDTFFSTKLQDSKVIKIPTYHFHDGFLKYTSIMDKQFPEHLEKIEMNSKEIELRFYKACIGWVRYKPMLMYITNKDTFSTDIANMRKKLEYSIDGMNRLIKHSKDCDFKKLLSELDTYSKNVISDYNEYQQVNNIWNKLKTGYNI